MKALPATIHAIATVMELKPSTNTVQPSAMATNYFNHIMQTEPSTVPVANTVPEARLEPASLGNKILNNLQNTSAEINNGWQAVTKSIASQNAQPSMADLLQTQTQLLQASIHYELVGKAIAKSTQNIDSIVRMQ